jgi:hypothetical protein
VGVELGNLAHSDEGCAVKYRDSLISGRVGKSIELISGTWDAGNNAQSYPVLHFQQ